MTQNPWYPHYVGDYQQKTSHLSMIEHGAYRLLLDHYYATNSPLPADHKIIYRICRVSERKERQIIDKILNEFFTRDDTGAYAVYRNKMCDLILAKRLNYSNTQSANAKKRHMQSHIPSHMPEEQPNASQNPAYTRTIAPASLSYSDSEIEKKERKKEKEVVARAENSPKADPDDFYANIIRLTGEQVREWAKTYHTIPDLRGELLAIDQKFIRQNIGNEWMGTLSSWLNSAHQKNIRELKNKSPSSGRTPSPVAF